MKYSHLIYVLLLSVFVARNTLCQWQNVAPQLLGTTSIPSGGATIYKSGKIWTGIQRRLWMSSDDGTTWSNRTPPFLQSTSIINDIDFYDENIGTVATDVGLFLTSDAGITWQEISPQPQFGYVSVKFFRTPQDIAVCDDASNTIAITRNGGATWSTTVITTKGNTVMNIQTRRAGDIYALIIGDPKIQRKSLIVWSEDNGITWPYVSGKFDYDCYSFALDPCDINTSYVSNEELYTPTDGVKTLYISNNNGGLFYSATSKLTDYLCGSVVITPSSIIYFQTIANGIMRSTDAGKTWISIGGPNGLSDSRLIAAKDDNTIFATDAAGNIWKTSNSGGNPIIGKGGFISFTPDSLFQRDSEMLCAELDKFLRISTGGCPIPSIDSIIFTGTAAGDYSLLRINLDSIVVKFAPSATGIRIAAMVITSSTGKKISIPLLGTGISSPYNLKASVASLFDDDSVEVICQSILKGFSVLSSLCANSKVESQTITGIGMSDYLITTPVPDSLTGNDSVFITFKPSAIGLRTASFNLMLTDGKQIIIPLNGSGKVDTYSISAFPPILFNEDTVALCDKLIKNFHIHSSSDCAIPKVASQILNGPASNDYTLVSIVPDSLTGDDVVTISFTPSGLGIRNGQYMLTLQDGKQIIVMLEGTGKNAPYTITSSVSNLFNNDSLYMCEDSVQTFHLFLSPCAILHVKSQIIIGSPTDYTITSAASDSLANDNIITISFAPKTSGILDANYQLTLDDGNVITIPLLGYGKPTTPLTLVTTDSFNTNVIGETIHIPIAINGLEKPQPIQMNISFDRNLEYLGTTSSSGGSLDIPGTTTKNFSKIMIPANLIDINAITAYANFNVFADTEMISTVYFDSLSVLINRAECYYNSDTRTKAVIAGLAGCGVTIISDFVRYGKKVQLRINPNPGTDIFTVTNSEFLGFVNISVVDKLGVVRISQNSELSVSKDIKLNLKSLPSGIYFIRVSGINGVIPVVLRK